MSTQVEAIAEIRLHLGLVADWLKSVGASDPSEIVADGGVTAGMVIQREAIEVQMPRLDRIIAALEQPA